MEEVLKFQSSNRPVWQPVMAIFHKLFFFLLILSLLLSGCSGATPTLGVAGQPTLVFIYTDG